MNHKVYKDTIDVLLCWPTYFWAWDLRKAMDTQDTPLEKTDFPLSSGYQLQIASWLGMGSHIYFLVQGLYMAWSCADPVNAARVSVISYV